MNPFRAQVEGALEILELRSPREYCWMGQVFRWNGGPTADGDPMTGARRLLQARLYADFYLTGMPAPASAPQAWRLDLATRSTDEQLSAANRGSGSREPGWALSRREGASMVVARDGLEIWADPAAVLGGGAGVSLGEAVTLRLPKERIGASSGFYTVIGDAGQGAETSEIDRFYWHLRRAGTEQVVAHASEILNRMEIPFRLKTVDDPRGYRRCDTAVLYTRRVDRRSASAAVELIWTRLGDHLRDAVPCLTLALAPGVGFAEDPGGDESFGSHRCGVIADALVRAWQAGARPEDRIVHVAAAFAAAGLDLRMPYLGPGSGEAPAPWIPRS